MSGLIGGCAEGTSPLNERYSIVSADEAYNSALEKATNRDSAAFPRDNGGPLVRKENYRALVEFNHIVANEFLVAADHSRRLGKYGNGALILTAVLYGVGSTNGVNSDTLTNGLIAGLGLSEAIHYSGSNVSADAFLAAAEQSACIAARGAKKLNPPGKKLPTDSDANELWEAMVVVQADLRRNLRRKHVGFIRLATGLLDPSKHEMESYELSRAQQRLRAHTKQEKMRSEAGGKVSNAGDEVNNTLRYQLLECLAQETSGDT